MDSSGHAPRLPPMAGVKRAAGAAWGAAVGDPLAAPLDSFSGALLRGTTHRALSMDESAQFVAAAQAGARAQREVDTARGTGVFETYELGIAIVRSSKLYANQRRSNRQLPGGSDSTTAACYMLGGTPDSTLSPLVARVSPCDPREERCKAVERVLKDKTRGAICSLNGDNPREARADNLAAVRICEVVADILVAYAAKRLLANLQELYKSNAAKDSTIAELRAQLDGAKRRRVDCACWCGARSADNAPVADPAQYSAPQIHNGARVAADSLSVALASRALPLPPPPALTHPPRSASIGAVSSPSLATSSMGLGAPSLVAGATPLGYAAGAFSGGLDAVAHWPQAAATRK